MQPIVDGLEAQYDEAVAFQRLNAADDAVGESSFKRLNLPGHPSVVIFDRQGRETYRGYGVLSEEELINAIQVAVDA